MLVVAFLSTGLYLNSLLCVFFFKLPDRGLSQQPKHMASNKTDINVVWRSVLPFWKWWRWWWRRQQKKGHSTVTTSCFLYLLMFSLMMNGQAIMRIGSRGSTPSWLGSSLPFPVEKMTRDGDGILIYTGKGGWRRRGGKRKYIYDFPIEVVSPSKNQTKRLLSFLHVKWRERERIHWVKCLQIGRREKDATANGY